MPVGITRTQRVLLRGSLRCLIFFGALILLLRLGNSFGGVLSWTARVDQTRVPARTDDVFVYQDAVQVDMTDPSTPLWISTLVPTVILCTAMILVGFLLLRIFHETDAGRPFFDASARRLRAVSLVVGVAAILIPLTRAWADDMVLEAAIPRLEPTGPNVVQMATWLVVALVVRVIAEAFRIGTRLRDDTEGLV